LLRDVLESVARGETSVDEAEMSLKLLAVEEVGHMAKFDLGREVRHGVPEVVIAEGKSTDDVVEIVAKVVAATGRVIVSRAAVDQADALERSAKEQGWRVESSPGGTVVVRVAGLRDGGRGGRVGIIAAGTSDIGVAEEARVMACEMGCDVTTAYDVGVAGIHRLLSPLEEMVRSDVDVIVAVAGREGALPTLVAGMVDVPLIAVPTSYGYGFGGKGISALMAMLQSCSLGLAVVNIDGGIPAGAVAALIANRAAKYRVAGRRSRKGK
jgi:hypothetical protein